MSRYKVSWYKLDLFYVGRHPQKQPIDFELSDGCGLT